ncbi:CHAT domain-containing tetratricopeptide repeat protein [Nocardiopsis aegyptia]|uniref:Tetratricopeptide (TPR) repeat protein n=1 Tax=Nocardiopsis aegyptia TaxID=220378 RepID=A0A7Z0EIX2_9ACTN|nr:CHAT domain-containing protein [Nocardiopsis aegyptia]NYJ32817.1 tetratricopeptide (TPR) repeat protein [Nocardiopsis aegyptia]
MSAHTNPLSTALAHLDLITGNGSLDAPENPYAALAPPVEQDMARLGQSVEQSPGHVWDSTQARYVLGLYHWFRSMAVPPGDTRETALDEAAGHLVPCYAQGGYALPERLRPHVKMSALNWALEITGDLHVGLEADSHGWAEALWRRLLSDTPERDPRHLVLREALATVLNLRCSLLYQRFCLLGDPSDLDEAIRQGRGAVVEAPEGSSEARQARIALGTALLYKAQIATSDTTLDEGISVSELALEQAPRDDPGLPLLLSMLMSGLATRATRSGDMADADRAISLGRTYVPEMPFDNLDALHVALAAALLTRFGTTGDTIDLHEAIAYAQKAVSAAPEGHPKGAALHTYSSALIQRFKIQGDPGDLEQALQHAYDAVEAIPESNPIRISSVSHLSAVLSLVAEMHGAHEGLEDGIALARQAVTLAPETDPNRTFHLQHLIAALCIRYQRTGDPDDLDEAIRLSRRLVGALPEDSRHLPHVLDTLATALHLRYRRFGGLSDLDEAVQFGEDAIALNKNSRVSPSLVARNLAMVLLSRFQHLNRTFYKGMSGPRRQKVVDSVVDLDRARMLAHESVSISTDRFERSFCLGTLSTVLMFSAERYRSSRYLEEAISYGFLAVEATAPDSEFLVEHVTNLANCLSLRPEISPEHCSTEELDCAVELVERIMDDLPDDDRRRTLVLHQLGRTAQLRHQRSEDPDDLTRMIDAGVAITRSPFATPLQRARAGMVASAQLAAVDPDRAAELASEAVALLPQLAPHRLRHHEHRDNLRNVSGLAGHAAALTLSSHGGAHQRAERAVQLLETGKGVVFTQALGMRGDLSALRREQPELAQRFEFLRGLLDEEGEDSLFSSISTAQAPDLDRHETAREFTELLDQIQSIEGFASFARPPSTANLNSAASEGPIVMFSTSFHRCDALILTPAGIVHLPLPDLTLEDIMDRGNQFTELVRTSWHGHTQAQREEAQTRVVDVLAWVWDCITGPVLQALGFHGPPAKGEPWPRVWWAPSGALSLLPLHASGHHDRSTQGGWTTVMDRVVSSYTPTVRSLQQARRSAASRTETTGGRALVVAMPTTPGLPHDGRLTHVDAEAATAVRALAPEVTVLREPDPSKGTKTSSNHLPTRDNVLRSLPDHMIAHFACHGVSEYDPSQSRLLLHDHAQAPFTADSVNAVQLDQARLAYLSACNTSSVEDMLLPDEAIHMASAFHLAGFTHVIGTLWQVSDDVAVTVAEKFYENLRAEDGLMHPDRAPFALHEAVRSLRAGDDLPLPEMDRTASPVLWASFIHTGP